MIIFWVLIIAGIVFLVRYLVTEGRSRSEKRERSSLEILKSRYASGEISKDEFERIKRELIRS